MNWTTVWKNFAMVSLLIDWIPQRAEKRRIMTLTVYSFAVYAILGFHDNMLEYIILGLSALGIYDSFGHFFLSIEEGVLKKRKIWTLMAYGFAADVILGFHAGPYVLFEKMVIVGLVGGSLGLAMHESFVGEMIEEICGELRNTWPNQRTICIFL